MNIPGYLLTVLALCIIFFLAYWWGKIVGKRWMKKKKRRKEILNIDSGNTFDQQHSHQYWCSECSWTLKIQTNIKAVYRNLSALAVKMHQANSPDCIGWVGYR